MALRRSGRRKKRAAKAKKRSAKRGARRSPARRSPARTARKARKRSGAARKARGRKTAGRAPAAGRGKARAAGRGRARAAARAKPAAKRRASAKSAKPRPRKPPSGSTAPRKRAAPKSAAAGRAPLQAASAARARAKRATGRAARARGATSVPARPGPTTAPAALASALARRVLGHARIVLAPTHAGGVRDAATARANLEDAAAGREARWLGFGLTEGRTVALSPDLLRGMLALADAFSFRVSEVAGGLHLADSPHSAGLAFDIDAIGGKPVGPRNPYVAGVCQRLRKLGAREVRGPGDVGYAVHVHAAWPRRRP